MNAASQQFHLPIEFASEPTLAEYLPGPNAEAVAAVAAMAAGVGEPFQFLFGSPGTGKTHLVQAACLESARRGLRSHYVPLATPGLEPTLLDDLEQLALVAIDDVQAIAGDAVWERALFALFNRIRERGHRLLVSANAAPDALPVQLADLRSRLQWGPRYCLLPLSEGDCEQLLIDAARRRGMTFSADLVRYVMHNHPRDPASLLELVARVDSLSLREQRQPTIPLIRRVMQSDA